jgi:hypothetical protein
MCVSVAAQQGQAGRSGRGQQDSARYGSKQELTGVSVAEELPIRLAHRVKELDNLPHNLSQMPSIEKVKQWYAESFQVSRGSRSSSRSRKDEGGCGVRLGVDTLSRRNSSPSRDRSYHQQSKMRS